MLFPDSKRGTWEEQGFASQACFTDPRAVARTLVFEDGATLGARQSLRVSRLIDGSSILMS